MDNLKDDQKKISPDDFRIDPKKQDFEFTELTGTNEISVNERFINPGVILKPVVLFVGPKTVGKTVTLLRICHYINSSSMSDFRVEVNEGFRSDDDYIKVIRNFKDLLSNINFAPKRTSSIGFIMVDVYYKEELYCHILEAPGEHYYDVKEPQNKGFLHYLASILFMDKKKVVVYFFENNMFSNLSLNVQQHQSFYSDRISDLHKRLTKKRDKAIILMNKVDELTGRINHQSIKQNILSNVNYTSFKNSIRSFDLKENQFVAFSSGSFQNTDNEDNPLTWAMGDSRYPKDLWLAIDRAVVGSWGCKFW